MAEVERNGVGVRIGSKQVRRDMRLQNIDGNEELAGSVDNSQRDPKIAGVEGLERVMWEIGRC